MGERALNKKPSLLASAIATAFLEPFAKASALLADKIRWPTNRAAKKFSAALTGRRYYVSI